MAVTYSHANTQITCTGAANTFNGLYTADKAGTEELVHVRNIVGADGANVAVNHALRPADYYVLGLADVYITITNFTANGSILLTGTEEYGAAQTETIAFTGNGVYPTTKYWRTITHTRVTVFAGNFSYTLTQGQWGVVWKIGLNTYRLDCRLYIGDGATATDLTSNKENIIFDCANQGSTLRDFYITAAATFQLGTLTASSTGSLGSNLIWDSPKSYIYCDIYGTLNLYNSHVTEYNSQGAAGSVVWRSQAGGTINSYDTSYTTLRYAFASVGTCTILSVRDTVNAPYTYYYASVPPTSLTLTDMLCMNHGTVNYALEISSAGATTATVRGLKVLTASTNPYTDIFMNTCLGTTLNLINCTFQGWTFKWTASNAATKVYRKYTMDVKVTDKTDTAINGATVAVADKDGNAVFSVATGADGRIAQQTFSRGYYYPTTGDTLQEYAPHTVTITAAGYQNYVKQFTLTKAVDWEIKLAKQRAILFNQGNPVLDLTPKDPESQNVMAL